MIDQRPPPLLQTLVSFRWTLLSTASLTFALLAVAIVVLVRPHATVRSAVEIGSLLRIGKDEPVDPPELVARRIPTVYASAALLDLANRGVPISTLNALQNSSTESIGDTVSIQSIVDPSAAIDAKEFHQKIIDRIIQEERGRTAFVRDTFVARTVLAKRSADGLDERITDNLKAIDSFDAQAEEVRSSLRTQQEELTTVQQQRRATQASEGASVFPPEIRAIRENISAQLKLLSDISIARNQVGRDLTRARVAQWKHELALTDAQLSLKSVSETRVMLAPEIVPDPASSRRIELLFVAAIASILVAFGLAALLHNFFVVTRA